MMRVRTRMPLLRADPKGAPPVMLPDLIFTAQSAALRVWAGTLDDDDLARPSTLPGWSVADLLSHLVVVHDAVAALRPAGGEQAGGEQAGGEQAGGEQGGDDALAVADYIAGYAARAQQVAETARTIARDTASDPLGAWDAASAQARQTMGALGAADRLVTTRRGPMLASAYLTTRVIELVVHADDLHRSLPHRPAPPVLPSARAHVLTALREVLTARSGDPEVLAAASALDEQEFIDLAAGRRPPGPEVPATLGGLLPLL